jgi:hypothetical protein
VMWGTDLLVIIAVGQCATHHVLEGSLGCARLPCATPPSCTTSTCCSTLRAAILQT